MGPTGAIIMGFFGAVFFIAALGPIVGWMNPILLLPMGVFGTISVRYVALVRRATPAKRERTARANKVILWSSIGEGIGILIVVNVLVNVGRADLILSGIAAVVGVHFLPMAYGIPFRAFYVVGSAVLSAATLGMLLHQPNGAAVAGVATAAALWIASAAALRRGTLRTSREGSPERAPERESVVVGD